LITKHQLAKLQQELNAADPSMQPRPLIISYAGNKASIPAINWEGTREEAKELLSRLPYCEWSPHIHDDIDRWDES